MSALDLATRLYAVVTLFILRVSGEMCQNMSYIGA